MRWVMPFFCIIKYDCGKSIYLSDVLLFFHIIEKVIMYENDYGKSIYISDVFLPYYWGGDNVWKWLLVSHKMHQSIFTYFNKPLCWNIINLGLQ